jgi:hypothetical protein
VLRQTGHGHTLPPAHRTRLAAAGWRLLGWKA